MYVDNLLQNEMSSFYKVKDWNFINIFWWNASVIYYCVLTQRLTVPNIPVYLYNFTSIHSPAGTCRHLQTAGFKTRSTRD